ncbi:MAG TPA: glutathione S-transferase [Polyangiaceae bacterium]
MNEPASLRLYRHPLSGHCHRVELLLSLAALPCELVSVDLAAGAHKHPSFLEQNGFGQIPVLVHGDAVLPDSNAILLYLAETFPSAAEYLPRTPKQRAALQRWLSVAAGQLAQGPAAARLVRVFGSKLDHAEAVANARALFAVFERELSQRDFFVGDAPTLADFSLYAYTAHAPEGGVSLEPYPHVRAWLARLEGLPRFVRMQRAGVS